MVEMLTLVALIAVLTPFVVFLSVKLGTYGFFRARQIFWENKKHEEQKTTRKS